MSKWKGICRTEHTQVLVNTEDKLITLLGDERHPVCSITIAIEDLQLALDLAHTAVKMEGRY